MNLLYPVGKNLAQIHFRENKSLIWELFFWGGGGKDMMVWDLLVGWVGWLGLGTFLGFGWGEAWPRWPPWIRQWVLA